MKIFVIILHFGKLSVTQKCVESLYKTENTGFFTVIVNNAQERISEKYFGKKRGLSVINNTQNLGFAGGVNVGIAYACSHHADNVLLLNNDTCITRPIILQLSQNFLKNKQLGIIAPAIHFIRNGQALYDLGGRYNHWTGRTTHTEVTQIQDESFQKAEYVSGCCMMIKKEVFSKIGKFDENFFLYYEDVDFCLRARKSGYNVAVDPACVIDHALSTSAGKLSEISTYHQIRSGRIFGKKYFSSSWVGMLQMLFVVYQAIIFVIKSHHVSACKALFSEI